MYKLKKGQPAFQVTDGPDRGKTFRTGETYAEIPAGEKARFETVKQKKARAAGSAAGQEGDES